MNDSIIDAIIGSLAISVRRDAVKNLLAGNDAGCFSTEQYVRAYEAIVKWKMGSRAEQAARMHLNGLPDLVRETRPDVWVSVQFLGGNDGQEDPRRPGS